MSKPYIVISIPTKSDIHAETVGWVLQTVKAGSEKFDVGVHIVWSSYPVEMQRNIQVKKFLAEERFTHLFLLDSDCVPPPGVLDKLFDYDLDIVTSVAPGLVGGRPVFTAAIRVPKDKEVDGKKFFFPAVDDKSCTGLKSVDGIGMTGVLIKRNVFETLKPPYFKMVFDETGTNIELGEDFYFSQTAKEAGYEIWADFDLRQQHVKNLIL